MNIATQEENSNNIDRFINLIAEHIYDGELTRYNLHELIKGIYVENADIPNDPETDEPTSADPDNGDYVTFSNKPKSRTAKTHRIRKIHIKYDFIGFIPINELMKYENKSENRENVLN